MRSKLIKIKDKLSHLKKRIDSAKEQRISDHLKLENEEKDLFQMNTSNLSKQKVVVEIAPITVAKSTVTIMAVLFLAILLWQISNILIVFFIAFFITAALDPLIDGLQRYKVPRAIGVLLVYIVIFMFIGMMFSQLLPVIAKQLVDIATSIGKFITDLPNYDISKLPFSEDLRPYLEKLYSGIDFKTVAEQLQNALQGVSSSLLNLGSNLWTAVQIISNGLMNTLLIMILVFLMTVDEKAVEDFCLNLFPTKYSKYISKRMTVIKEKIGHWIRGQFFVSFISAIITFIGLSIFGIEYSLTLSVIAGVMMVIPMFGRVFAWVFSVPIVFNQSPILALWLTIFYLLVSQIEINILVPYLMNKALGLNPIIIIFSMMVGFQFMNIPGLILAIPLATIFAVFIKDFTRKMNGESVTISD